MTIEFTEVYDEASIADGAHRRKIRTQGFAAGSVFGSHRRRLILVGVAQAGSNADDPEIPVSGVHTLSRSAMGAASQGLFASGMSSRRLTPFGFPGARNDAGGTARRRLSSWGRYEDSAAGHALLVARPFAMGSYGGIWFESLIELLDIGTDHASLPVCGLVDQFRVRGMPDDSLIALARASDRIELGDMLAVVLRELIAEGFSLSGEASRNFLAVESLSDALRFAGLASSQLEALNIVAAAIAFGELSRARAIEGLQDDMALGSTIETALRLGAQLVDALVLEGAAGPAVTFGALVQDRVGLDAAGVAQLTAMEALRDGVGLALHLNLDGGQYVAYVINTESKGITQYENYPFNSFARLGDRYLGMTPDGIRELDGPDDAGSPIAARFRLAMTTLGTGRMKRMIAAYLGYTATGDLRLKTITVGVDGVKQANHYRLHAQPADNPREARVKIGQGLRSVYWGFEVEAIDGAAFMVDVLALQPLVIDGRIQGEGGGNR